MVWVPVLVVIDMIPHDMKLAVVYVARGFMMMMIEMIRMTEI
jgi:hypothetical protein